LGVLLLEIILGHTVWRRLPWTKSIQRSVFRGKSRGIIGRLRRRWLNKVT